MISLQRIVSFLVFALLVVTFPIVRAENKSFYADTDALSANFLREQDVFEATEKFFPHKKVQRKELLIAALRNLDYFGGRACLVPFLDVDRASEFACYAERAWKSGVLLNAERNLYPNQAVSAEEALYTIIFLEGLRMPPVFVADMEKWTDAPTLPQYRAAVQVALEKKFWKPLSKNTIGTQEIITKTQLADILYAVRSARTEQKVRVEVRGNQQSLQQEKLEFILEKLTNTYLHSDQLTEDELVEQAILGMVQSLDDTYTEYMPVQKTEKFDRQTSGKVEGIGAILSTKENFVYVARVFPETPAFHAGLRAQDMILSVDGMDMEGKNSSQVAEYIRGPEGEKVTLVIQRGDQKISFTISRARITIPFLQSTLLPENILQIELVQFEQNVAQQFADVLAQYAETDLQGIIVDLRANPGGQLQVVLEMLGEILPKGSIGIWEKARDYEIKRRVSGSAQYTNIPLIVLQNQYSASASEIFAGAVQDYKRGIVMGQQSFGKGTVQRIFRFADNTSFKFTIAEWLTPLKQSIQSVGITPDIVIESDNTSSEDVVFQRAMNMLKRGQVKVNLQ